MGTCASYALNFRDPQATAALARHLERYLAIRPLFAADFYPLTEWSDDPSKWLAFQFHDPEKGEGIIQAFCSGAGTRDDCRVKLHGLDPATECVVTDWDHPETPHRVSGSTLMDGGLDVGGPGCKDAVVFQYLKVKTNVGGDKAEDWRTKAEGL